MYRAWQGSLLSHIASTLHSSLKETFTRFSVDTDGNIADSSVINLAMETRSSPVNIKCLETRSSTFKYNTSWEHEVTHFKQYTLLS